MRFSRALILSCAVGGLGLASAVVAQTPVQTPQPSPQVQPQPAPAPPPPVIDPPPADISDLLPPEPIPEPDPEPVAPAPVTKAPEEPEEEKPPMKRARYGVAVLQALDKVTAETIRFEAPVGQPIRYKSLIFTVRACELTAPDEPAPDAVAYLTIDSQPLARPGRPAPQARQAFRGWMYAAAPALNPLEHPAYDAWLVTCRAAAPDRDN